MSHIHFNMSNIYLYMSKIHTKNPNNLSINIYLIKTDFIINNTTILFILLGQKLNYYKLILKIFLSLLNFKWATSTATTTIIFFFNVLSNVINCFCKNSIRFSIKCIISIINLGNNYFSRLCKNFSNIS